MTTRSAHRAARTLAVLLGGRSGVARRRGSRDEAGIALLSVLLASAVVGALAITVASVGVNALATANRDRQAESAFNVSEQGVAQATAWLQAHGIGVINSCAETPASCSLDWGRPSGHSVTVSLGVSYAVSIAPKVTATDATHPGTEFKPPASTSGVYVVTSTGQAGAGPGARTVSVELTVAPFSFPIGVFASQVNSGGNGGIHYESLFTSGCVYKRSHTTFTGTDAYYGVPAAAHSSLYITDSQGSGQTCSPDNKSVHKSGACNTSYPYDDDHQGGPLHSGDGCYGGYTYGGAPYSSSYVASASAMASQWNYNPSGLTSSQLDALRTAAQAQGFYFTNTTAIPSALAQTTSAATYPNPVLFYDLSGAAAGGTVDLNGLTGYSRAYPLSASDSRCTPAGAVVVVLNGNVKLNGNTVLVASVFAPGPAPYGAVAKANGGAQLIGTLFANSIDLTGTADIYLDQCFLQNMPGALLSMSMSNFVEGDRPVG